MSSSTPGSISVPCGLATHGKDHHVYAHYSIFPSAIIIAILSPVAVVGNALIVAAIWKKAFQRTPLHILLSGLAITDLCTGVIAQPFVAASNLLYVTKPKVVCDQPVLYITIRAIGGASTTCSISITLLFTTLLSVERWLHMSRRSLMTSRQGCLTAIVFSLLPIPALVLRSMETINPGTAKQQLEITIMAGILFCLLATFFAYFKIFRIIRNHQLQISDSQSSQNFGQLAINLAKYRKSVNTILYILGLYCLCFLPITVSLSVQFKVGYNSKLMLALSVSHVLLFSSSSLNPVLYLWKMNDIRNGVKRPFFIERPRDISQGTTSSQ